MNVDKPKGIYSMRPIVYMVKRNDRKQKVVESGEDEYGKRD